ncbi:ogr/Delta-like zinc finger family protein [Escherichia coli]|nr:transcriptional regulator [Escherichia coli]EHL6433998.1 ogr/Delta-like zinc finger family protein [Escherichia coli]HBQ4879735.1 ogr/Delta-like zinc finger family protein [Escherichia coli]
MHPCPFCNEKASTIRTSRDANDTGTIREKYYICSHCGARFVTYEFVRRVLSIPLIANGDEGLELIDAMKLHEKLSGAQFPLLTA